MKCLASLDLQKERCPAFGGNILGEDLWAELGRRVLNLSGTHKDRGFVRTKGKKMPRTGTPNLLPLIKTAKHCSAVSRKPRD
jgi:hypothetical protein